MRVAKNAIKEVILFTQPSEIVNANSASAIEKSCFPSMKVPTRQAW